MDGRQTSKLLISKKLDILIELLLSTEYVYIHKLKKYWFKKEFIWVYSNYVLKLAFYLDISIVIFFFTKSKKKKEK